jgi:hypothetical protein
MLDPTFFEAKLEHQINRDGEKLHEFRTPSRAHALGSKASSLAHASKGDKPEPLGSSGRYPENQRLEQIFQLQSRYFEDPKHPGSERSDRKERAGGLSNMA